MNRSETYHGQYSAEAYVSGERRFRSFKYALERYDQVSVGFYWPDQASKEPIPVTGVINRVYREHEVPWVEFKYLEHDKASAEMMSIVNDFIRPEDEDPEHTDLVEQYKARREAVENHHLAFELHKLRKEAGMIIEGIYLEGPVGINLDSFNWRITAFVMKNIVEDPTSLRGQ